MLLEVHRVAITLYTIQVAQWRRCQGLGVHFLDTTAKSGIPAFAPDFKRVWQYKKNEISEKVYTEIYMEKMRQSQIDHADRWDELESYESLAIACYCPKDVFCHRHLFVSVLEKRLRAKGIEVLLGGEITKHHPESILRVSNDDQPTGTASETN